MGVSLPSCCSCHACLWILFRVKHTAGMHTSLCIHASGSCRGVEQYELVSGCSPERAQIVRQVACHQEHGCDVGVRSWESIGSWQLLYPCQVVGIVCMQVADGIQLQLPLYLLLHQPTGHEQVTVRPPQAQRDLASGTDAVALTYRGQLRGWGAVVCPGHNLAAAG